MNERKIIRFDFQKFAKLVAQGLENIGTTQVEEAKRVDAIQADMMGLERSISRSDDIIVNPLWDKVFFGIFNACDDNIFTKVERVDHFIKCADNAYKELLKIKQRGEPK